LQQPQQSDRSNNATTATPQQQVSATTSNHNNSNLNNCCISTFLLSVLLLLIVVVVIVVVVPTLSLFLPFSSLALALEAMAGSVGALVENRSICHLVPFFIRIIFSMSYIFIFVCYSTSRLSQSEYVLPGIL